MNIQQRCPWHCRKDSLERLEAGTQRLAETWNESKPGQDNSFTRKGRIELLEKWKEVSQQDALSVGGGRGCGWSEYGKPTRFSHLLWLGSASVGGSGTTSLHSFRLTIITK